MFRPLRSGAQAAGASEMMLKQQLRNKWAPNHLMLQLRKTSEPGDDAIPRIKRAKSRNIVRRWKGKNKNQSRLWVKNRLWANTALLHQRHKEDSTLNANLENILNNSAALIQSVCECVCALLCCYTSSKHFSFSSQRSSLHRITYFLPLSKHHTNTLKWFVCECVSGCCLYKLYLNCGNKNELNKSEK